MKFSKDAKPFILLRSLIISYIITIILLLIIALLLYKLKLSSGQLNIGITLTYILSCFIGGFITGKSARLKRYLWGGLGGLLYFLILLLVSFIFSNPLDNGIAQIILVFALCTGGGAMGGMIS
ncbi:MAG: TIGR04086 family membrane protein [Lachnospiraceae bacterium]|nr:TIGR04086 family membrane protein [Lachnospiraceae bacterium]